MNYIVTSHTSFLLKLTKTRVDSLEESIKVCEHKIALLKGTGGNTAAIAKEIANLENSIKVHCEKIKKTNDMIAKLRMQLQQQEKKIQEDWDSYLTQCRKSEQDILLYLKEDMARFLADLEKLKSITNKEITGRTKLIGNLEQLVSFVDKIYKSEHDFLEKLEELEKQSTTANVIKELEKEKQSWLEGAELIDEAIGVFKKGDQIIRDTIESTKKYCAILNPNGIARAALQAELDREEYLKEIAENRLKIAESGNITELSTHDLSAALKDEHGTLSKELVQLEDHLKKDDLTSYSHEEHEKRQEEIDALIKEQSLYESELVALDKQCVMLRQERMQLEAKIEVSVKNKNFAEVKQYTVKIKELDTTTKAILIQQKAIAEHTAKSISTIADKSGNATSIHPSKIEEKQNNVLLLLAKTIRDIAELKNEFKDITPPSAVQEKLRTLEQYKQKLIEYVIELQNITQHPDSSKAISSKFQEIDKNFDTQTQLDTMHANGLLISNGQCKGPSLSERAAATKESPSDTKGPQPGETKKPGNTKH